MSYNSIDLFETGEETMALNRDDIAGIFRDPPVIQTERLCFRKMLRRDASDMFEYSRTREVTEYLLWEPHPDKAYTLRYLTYIQSRYRAGDFYDWAVIWRATDKMIGTSGYTRFNFEANSAEIGYVFNSSYWGMGIASEAVMELLRFGFAELGLHRIEAKFMAGNDRSYHVMEKVGMTFEGIQRDSMFVKGKYVSVGTCSILRNEYIRTYGI